MPYKQMISTETGYWQITSAPNLLYIRSAVKNSFRDEAQAPERIDREIELKGVYMRSTTKEQTPPTHPKTGNPPILQDFLSIMRSRLNVIGTSLYLLENSLESQHHPSKKYVEKIKQELEALRLLING